MQVPFCPSSKVALNNYAYLDPGATDTHDVDDRTVLTVRPVSSGTLSPHTPSSIKEF